MKTFLPAGLLVAAALATAPAPASACIPTIDVVEYEWPFSIDVSVCVWPDGRPAEAYLQGGVGPMDPVLRIQAIDLDYNPLPNLPLEDVAWFFDSGPGALCADALSGPVTDADGWVEVPFRGGGHRGPDDHPSFFLLTLNLCPALELWLPAQVYFNSPDLDGDLDVDLSDAGFFTEDLYGAGGYRSDFNWDGRVNVSDAGVLAGSFGASCP